MDWEPCSEIGEQKENIFIGFAAGITLMIPYVLRCRYETYDPLPCTTDLSRWEGTFYLRCHQPAPAIIAVWFLEMVYIVSGYLHTQD